VRLVNRCVAAALPRALSRGLACGLLFCLAVQSTASTDSPEAQAAEDLVFTVYYEGFTEELAEQLTPAGARHLVDVLRAGDEPRFHSNIVLALGMSGCDQAFETLAWYGRDDAEPVESGVYRARIAVPVAMGYLARSDDRANAWLVRRAREGVHAPAWSLAGRPSAGLADTMRSQVMNGLAVSGRDDAAALLEQLATDGADRAAGAALEWMQRVRAEAASSGTRR